MDNTEKRKKIKEKTLKRQLDIMLRSSTSEEIEELKNVLIKYMDTKKKK